MLDEAKKHQVRSFQHTTSISKILPAQINIKEPVLLEEFPKENYANSWVNTINPQNKSDGKRVNI